MKTSQLFKRTFSSLAIGIALNACGVPYQASGGFGMGGYSSRELGNNTLEVSYLTGRSADTGTIKHYVMYRSAELAQEHGFEAFRLLNLSGYSVGGAYGTTSSVTAKIALLHPDTAERQRAETRKLFLGAGIYQKAEIYLAAEIMEKLEKRIQR